MGRFSKTSENEAQQLEEERQCLMELSEKELLVEILLELKELNRQSQDIRRRQVIWSDW